MKTTMPIFEYHCNDCGTNFETLVLSAREKAEAASCSDCGSESVEKLFSTFAAQTSNGAAELGPCASRAGGVCQAGGGSIPCGSLN